MQAIRLEQGLLEQGLRLRTDLPVPIPARDEALVRVRLAGVCATDLELTRGYLPFRGTLGHEFVGTVVRAAQAPSLAGRRVVGDINLCCGACAQCLAGRPSHCERRQVIGIRERDGAFAEYLCLPVRNLHPVPDAVPDDAAVFAEPLAAALEIPQQVSVRADQRVLVVGAGRLGQLIARVLRLSGCALSVVARHDHQRERLALAGITAVSETQVEPHSADLVVEATGAPGGFALARRALRPRGTLVLKSTYHGRLELDLSSLVVDEITLVGSRCGPLPAALRLLQQGLVDPRPLIDARLPLARGLEALQRAAEAQVMKVLLDCGTDPA
ncbi:alcohol dehydrogenase catalytic domain-containing protein [Thiohalocapsa marina]|uniref:Alcohol dehydrogenase catalytic domain-containing protein n=1 Tax=Thiohalocapsa marina TaxID=424902 RepID=A0A5M8FVF9_9GAMM|nr:alcohol dehydrogenase catalytic domain-containing protein [Thiohalocapsa marina]KAA6187775.1 alcohol dehydrogenase catalytic domain-containing protein [Thiohalocapsa marina]